MARDSLFTNQASAAHEVASPFSSSEDVQLAQALTEVLITDGPAYHVTSLSTLGQKFADAKVGEQFNAWANGDLSAVVSSSQLKTAIREFLPLVCERATIPNKDTDACLRRLTYVMPTVVKELAPVEPELKDSPRAFRFNLDELRRRLR